MKGPRHESAVRRVAADAERFGIIKTFDEAHSRTLWVTTCKCGVTSSHCWELAKAETMAGNLRRQGWRIETGKSPTCPDCVTKECLSVTKTIGPDPKIARKIYAALDEHFDDKKRVYLAGYSDEEVAKSLDVSQEIVISIRKAAYGELAVDSAMSKLGDDIMLVRLEFDEAINTLTKSFNIKFAELDRQFAMLRSSKKAAI